MRAQAWREQLVVSVYYVYVGVVLHGCGPELGNLRLE